MKYKEINEKVPLVNVVKLGSYEEVDAADLSTITRNDTDKGVKLDGMIIRGYETKFADGTNENGERYSKECLDKFFEQYYVKHKLNMPFTIQHHTDLQHLCGRVLTVEVNSVGFYFVCYIPRSYPEYERVKTLIKEGVLQGLSKEGWCTKGKCYWTKDGNFDYYLIEEMEMLGMSLVTTPANGNPLEKAQEVKNALTIIKNANIENAEKDDFEAMLNN